MMTQKLIVKKKHKTVNKKLPKNHKLMNKNLVKKSKEM